MKKLICFPKMLFGDCNMASHDERIGNAKRVSTRVFYFQGFLVIPLCLAEPVSPQHDLCKRVETLCGCLRVFQSMRAIERTSGKILCKRILVQRQIRIGDTRKPIGGIARKTDSL